MIKKNKSSRRETPKMAVALYVVAAIMAVVFIYIVITSIQYITGYASSYGMSVSDMLGDSIQYVISNSIAYLAYAAILFGIAKVWVALLSKASADVRTSDQENVKEEVEEESPDPETIPAADSGNKDSKG